MCYSEAFIACSEAPELLNAINVTTLHFVFLQFKNLISQEYFSLNSAEK